MTEENKYKIIKKLVETQGNKKRAALKLGCTSRHINRLIRGYKEHGKAYFVHGNRDKKPVTVIDRKTKDLIVELYVTKYFQSSFAHFQELLLRHENIKNKPRHNQHPSSRTTRHLPKGSPKYQKNSKKGTGIFANDHKIQKGSQKDSKFTT